MTQWKLVPARATDEMIRAATIRHYDDGGCLYISIYDAMLSAAPSPDGEEDEVERVARAICLSMDIDPDAETMMTMADPNGGTRELGECAEWQTMVEQARAAISAMRPAPKLTEEDRARVEEVRDQHDDREELFREEGYLYEANGEDAHRSVAFLLSLIDKLTEAG